MIWKHLKLYEIASYSKWARASKVPPPWRIGFNVDANHNVIILLKSFAFNIISVTESVLVLFPTFSNANRPEKALNFDTVQITLPPS